MCLESVISNVRVHKSRNQATSAPFTLSAADEASSTACVGGFEFDDSKSLEEGEKFYIESNEYPPFVGKIIPPGQRLQTQATKKDWSNVDPNTVNLRDQNDWTPLMRAVQNDDVEGVKSLLAAGTNVNAKKSDGCTALSFALRKGNVEIIRILLSAGAVMNGSSAQYTGH